MSEKNYIVNVLSVHNVAPNFYKDENGKYIWKNYEFILGPTDKKTDYAIVFDYIKKNATVNCDPQNTIHLATEPPIRNYYDNRYLGNFGWVVTFMKNINHPKAIFSQGGLGRHIYAHPKANLSDEDTTFNKLNQLLNKPKTKKLCVVCSDISGSKTHRKRFEFAQKLKQYFGDDIDWYGRGIRNFTDKSEFLPDYEYSIAIENSCHENYFTEKINDCFIAGSYPLYYGCPNISAFYPKNSYAWININDFDSAVSSIKSVIEGDYRTKYLQQLNEARDLALGEYSIPGTIKGIIDSIERGTVEKDFDSRIQNADLKNKKNSTNKITTLPAWQMPFSLRYQLKTQTSSKPKIKIIRLVGNLTFLNILTKLWGKFFYKTEIKINIEGESKSNGA